MFFASRGYATVIANSNEDPLLQEQLIASMIEHGVSALMIAPCYGAADDVFDGLLRAEIPTLQVLRRIDSRVTQLPFYTLWTFETGSYIATDHLDQKCVEQSGICRRRRRPGRLRRNARVGI